MKFLIALLSLTLCSSKLLFLETDNLSWYSLYSLGYGSLAAAFSEANNYYQPVEKQCFSDLFTAGNGAVPMLSLIEGRNQTKDWSRYMVSAVQVSLFTYHAISSCQVDKVFQPTGEDIVVNS